MHKPWLSFFSLPVGFQGLCMLETHQSLLDTCAPAVLCIGSTAKARFLNTLGIQSHGVAGTVSLFSWEKCLIVDCHIFHPDEVKKVTGGPAASQAKIHHLRSPTMDSVYSRLLRSFMHTVVFFVEDFAGVVPSAVTLARWIQVSMNDTIATAPRLLIVHSWGDARAFRRQVDTELLVMLRKASPERPYSMPEIIALREGCFRSVDLTTFEALRRETFGEKGAPPHDLRQDFEAKFRLMLDHLCEYSSAPFDLFNVTDAKSPLPACSTRYIERFVAHARRSGIDPVPQLALSFVRESVDYPLGNFTLEEIWTRRYLPLAKKLHIRPHDPLLVTRLEGEIRRLSRRSQILGDSIINAHSASLSAIQIQGRVFVCFSCLIRPPIHTLSCLHRICSYCLITYVNESLAVDSCTCLVRQCPFCKAPNSRQLYVQPAKARARVLILENLSVLSTVCLIRDIRTRLFGPIHEYIDLVVGINEGRLVTHDVFVGGLSTQESLERRSKKPLRRLKPALVRGQPPQAHDTLPGSLQVALQEGSNIITSWGEVAKCPNRSSLADLPTTIAADFWTSCDTVGIGARSDAVSIAAVLVASLFYIQVYSRTTFDGISHELVVLCRLEPGPHLMAVLYGLKDPRIRIHYQIDRVWSDSAPLCSDANWNVCKTGRPFTRSLGEIQALESEVHVDIESPTQIGSREPIANSPCVARAVAIKVNDDLRASPSRCSSEIFPDDTDGNTVSSEESVPGILHEGPQKPVKIITGGRVDSDWENESLNNNDKFYRPQNEAANSQVFHGIDHLQELLVQIRRQNR